MPQFFTLERPKGNIAYIRKDGDQLTLVSRNGRQMVINGTSLDPSEFTLTEVPEEVALSLVKPDKEPERMIEARVIETKTGTIANLGSSVTVQDVDDLAAAIDTAIRKGKLSTLDDIRDVITKTLRKTPAPSPIP